MTFPYHNKSILRPCTDQSIAVSPELGQNNEISVQFTPGEWRKDSDQGPMATREDILMTLQDLRNLLIRLISI